MTTLVLNFDRKCEILFETFCWGQNLSILACVVAVSFKHAKTRTMEGIKVMSLHWNSFVDQRSQISVNILHCFCIYYDFTEL